jgi:biopolymer transport protein ExbD
MLAPALLTPLAASVLLVCTAVAALPALLASGVEPRVPSRFDPLVSQPLLVVHSAQGRWYLDGQPIAAAALARLLAAADNRDRPVRLLASNSLSIADVSGALAWLRRQGGGSVELEPALLP